MSKGVQKIFSEASRTYEMINHLLTFGLDVLWRQKAAQMAASVGGTKWLDVCSGTGEMAISLYRARNGAKVTSVDFALPMLQVASTKPVAKGIHFALSDSGHLPFRDNEFDLVTISYATRNLNPNREKLIAYLEEFHRTLKPGGVFINLETSQPDSPIVRHLFHLYIRLVVRRLGGLISGSNTGYAYLSYTVPRFYHRRDFAGILFDAGFKDVKVAKLLLGTFAIHKATA
ncbi:MAG: ubiquinone/menaquinone biosynthesis methyltransferase [Candidatus Thorarchaeota archaeon]